MRDPTPHADIDLLLRSANFGQLESILSDLPTAIEIAEKRFSHKRAFEWMGVRVEVLLVTVPSMETHVFDGRYIVRWPNDTFADAPVGSLPVASRAALGQYRANHRRVRCAYREHLNDLRLLDEPTATH